MKAEKKRNRTEDGLPSHSAGLARVLIHPAEKTWTLHFQPVYGSADRQEHPVAGSWKAVRNQLELNFDRPVRIGRKGWEQIRREAVRLERKKNGWTVVLHFDSSQADKAAPELVHGRLLRQLLPVPGDGCKERTPIARLLPESGQVTVRGKVFWIEESGDGNRFFLGDESGSIVVRTVPGSSAERASVKIGDWLEVSGEIPADSAGGEAEMTAHFVTLCEPVERKDSAPEKRVELHAHTSRSLTGGVFSAGELIRTAARWGHPAVAITDHGSIASFHEAFLAGQRHHIRVIPGMEAAVVDDLAPVAFRPRPGRLSDETVVVFDVETTGLSAVHDRMIELAAVKWRQGKIVDVFSTLIRPEYPLPEKITELTGITEEMLQDAPDEGEAVKRFFRFAGDAVLVAHHVKFDLGFLQEAAKRAGLGPVNHPAACTLELARILFPEMRSFRLSALCGHLDIPLKQHHRALDDAAAAAELWGRILEKLVEHQVEEMPQLSGLICKRDPRKLRPFHAVILARNVEGIRRLAELASRSRTGRDGLPRIPRSELLMNRSDWLIGSCGTHGEVIQAALLRPEEEVRELARFYDYLEVQPPESEEAREACRLLVRIGEELGIPVIAAGNSRYVDRSDELVFRILQYGREENPGKIRSGAHLRTTDEMLEEFRWLGERKARKIVVQSPAEIVRRIGEIRELPDRLPVHGRFSWNAGDEREASDLVRRYRDAHEEQWGRAEECRLTLGCLGRKI